MENVIFLDRDGVINAKAPPHRYITAWEDFVFLPGTAAALRRLKEAGFRLVVVSNQRCVARGMATMEEIDALHEKMCAALAAEGAAIDGIYVCPHAEGTCSCRKPDTGLFLQAEQRFAVNRDGSWMIGDSASDIEAGRRYGVRTVLVGGTCGFGETYSAADLPSAADLILGEAAQ